jgi:HlyD family secretion protein
VILVAVVLAFSMTRGEPFITVQSEKVARRNITEVVTASGKIQPVFQVKISPEVSGEIIELPVKEGQEVKKGDLLVKIKQDTYIANQNQAEASFKSALASETAARANLARSEAEYKRNEELFQRQLISDSIYFEFKTGVEVARANLIGATNQVAMSHAALARAKEDLAKTIIFSPLDATVTKLNSQLGERVVGTAMMTGTEIMTLANLNEMEARVDIGEMDVVLMAPGQIARLEMDAFKDRKFSGIVTEVANSSKGSGMGSSMSSSSSQDATKFEVRIRIKEKEQLRPGMSVTAEIETRYRTNALAVPIASVTTRMKKPENKSGTNAVIAATNSIVSTNSSTVSKSDKKAKEAAKPSEVVFIANGDRAKMVPVKIGISDETHWEIIDGLKESDEVITGGFRAISRELEDGKKIKKGRIGADDVKKKES